MILDIILAVAFVFCIILGAKKGFAKTVMGFCSYIISLVLGTIFFDSFKEFIYDYEPIAGVITAFKQSIENSVQSYISVEELPVFIESSVRNMGNDIASGISFLIVESVIAVLFVVALIIAVKICAFLFCQVVKLPVLKQFNLLLGGAVGALNGIIVCYVLGSVLIFAFTGNENGFIVSQLEQSVAASYFYKNNVILNILVGM